MGRWWSDVTARADLRDDDDDDEFYIRVLRLLILSHVWLYGVMVRALDLHW